MGRGAAGDAVHCACVPPMVADIVGASHQIFSHLLQVAAFVIQKGVVTEEVLNKVEMAMRAYEL